MGKTLSVCNDPFVVMLLYTELNGLYVVVKRNVSFLTSKFTKMSSVRDPG